MLYNYTVILQSKQHKPYRYKTIANNLSEVIKRLKFFKQNYIIKSIVRSPK